MLETLGHFKAELLNRLISAGHLLLFPVVYLAPQLSHKIIVLALAGLGSLVAWLAALRRYHLIADTPTSRIASAAQGYVELEGRCEPHPGSAPLGFLSGPPCVWYRYVTHRLSGRGWQFIDRGQSSETFLLLDESGTCVIDPEQAEVLTTHRRKWVSGYYKQQVEYLAPGDVIYALGELASFGAVTAPLDKRAEVSAVLSAWKQDRSELLERFDADGDGELDLKEWEEARAAAQRQVDRESAEWARTPDIHLLRAPSDRRPFILSNRDPRALAKRFVLWAWFHVGVFTAAVIWGIVLWAR